MISDSNVCVAIYALSFTLTEHLVNFYIFSIFMLRFLHLVNCFCVYIYTFCRKTEKNNFLGKNVNTGLQLVFIINEDLNLRGLISFIFHLIKTCHA